MRCFSFKTLVRQLLAQVRGRSCIAAVCSISLENSALTFCYEGLNKSAIIQKISLDEANAVSAKRNATGSVKVHVVDSNPTVLNPNGKFGEETSLLQANTRCKLGNVNWLL